MMALKSYTESEVHVKFVENGTTASSGTNYESSYAQFAIEKLSKQWHIGQYNSYFN